MVLRQASGRAGCDGRFEVPRSFLSTYPRSKPDFSPRRRPALKSLFSRAVGTVAWNSVRGERFRFLGREHRKHQHAATSVGAPRRHRPTRSCRSILRAGSSGVTRRSVPCGATSRRNSAAISSAASSASHFGHAIYTGCGQGFVVAFSCKGRGVCPSCNGRHMAQTAAHLADHVTPPRKKKPAGVMDGPAGVKWRG